MLQVTSSRVIPAPVDRVWSVVRDFNGHDRWHPIVKQSVIEERQPSDKVGCVRAFDLEGGESLRERLLALSDTETGFRYCLMDTPLPLFNYVAELRLSPVTMTDQCFAHWSAKFTTPKGEEERLSQLGRDNVQRDGLAAIEQAIAS